MSKKITRRQFIKESIGITVNLGLWVGMGQGINAKATVQCKKCGAINKYTNLYLDVLILYKEKIYCYNCGINLETLQSDIECDGYCNLSNKNNKKVDLPICCQISFPNHKRLSKNNMYNFTV